MEFRGYLLILALGVLLVIPVLALPVADRTQADLAPEDVGIADLQHGYKWLRNFGYVVLLSEEAVIGIDECLTCVLTACNSECQEVLIEALREPMNLFSNFYGVTISESEILPEKAMNIMRMKRCKKSDIHLESTEVGDSRQKRAAQPPPPLTAIKWDLDRFPILRISFKNYMSTMDRAVQEQVVTECAMLWAKESGLAFQFSDFEDETNIAIMFDRIDGEWGTVGIGYSPTPHKYSSLTLDNEEPWVKHGPSRTGVSFRWAMCHELGHTLNLDHSTNPDSLMYPTTIDQDETRLKAEDRAAIQAQYGQPDGRTMFGKKLPPRQAPYSGSQRQSYRPPAPSPPSPQVRQRSAPQTQQQLQQEQYQQRPPERSQQNHGPTTESYQPNYRPTPAPRQYSQPTLEQQRWQQQREKEWFAQQVRERELRAQQQQALPLPSPIQPNYRPTPAPQENSQPQPTFEQQSQEQREREWSEQQAKEQQQRAQQQQALPLPSPIQPNYRPTPAPQENSQPQPTFEQQSQEQREREWFEQQARERQQRAQQQPPLSRQPNYRPTYRPTPAPQQHPQPNLRQPNYRPNPQPLQTTEQEKERQQQSSHDDQRQTNKQRSGVELEELRRTFLQALSPSERAEHERQVSEFHAQQEQERQLQS